MIFSLLPGYFWVRRICNVYRFVICTLSEGKIVTVTFGFGLSMFLMSSKKVWTFDNEFECKCRVLKFTAYAISFLISCSVLILSLTCVKIRFSLFYRRISFLNCLQLAVSNFNMRCKIFESGIDQRVLSYKQYAS